MKTYVPKEAEPRWVLIDAEGKTLGRSPPGSPPSFGQAPPRLDPQHGHGGFRGGGEREKIRLTGKKLKQKVYTRYSGYPGGLKEIPAEKMLATHPERVLEHAVKGMLPKGPLGRRLFKRLKVYAGPTHPHQAQKPEKLEVK